MSNPQAHSIPDPCSNGARATRSRWRFVAFRAALVMLAIGSTIMTVAAPIAAAAPGSPGSGTDSAPQPENPCVLNLCFTKDPNPIVIGGDSHTAIIQFEYFTSIKTDGRIQLSRSSETDLSGNLKHPVTDFYAPTPFIYRIHNALVPTGGKYFWLVRATAGSQVAIKKGEVMTPYVAVSPQTVQIAP